MTRAGATAVNFGPAFAEIGLLRAQRGDREGALRALQEAVTYNAESGYRPMMIGTLDRTMYALAQLGDDEPVAVLAGVAIRGPLSELNHFYARGADAQTATLEVIKGRLGRIEFEDALSRGATMTYEQAVSYALEHLAELLAATSTATSQ